MKESRATYRMIKVKLGGICMLGATIRGLRRRRMLTLQKLSDLTGLSVGFLSQLENNQANPTLSTLRKVSAVLGTSVFALLAHEEASEGFLKIAVDGRRCFVASRGKATFEQLSGVMENGKLQALRCVLEPGVDTCEEPMPHGTWNDEEWAIVLKGEVFLEIGLERHKLCQDECVHFRPALPHRYCNTGTKRAVILAVMSPPNY